MMKSVCDAVARSEFHMSKEVFGWEQLFKSQERMEEWLAKKQGGLPVERPAFRSASQRMMEGLK